MSVDNMLHRSPVAKASARFKTFCALPNKGMPGDPQEDIIIPRNKGSVSVNQKGAKKVRT